VRYLPGPHRERAVARNRGIAVAAADLVAFLDGDDLWEPPKLERQLTALRDAPEAALCYTIARYVDAGGRPLPVRRPPAPLAGNIFPTLVRANRMILSSVVVRRTVLAQAGGFDECLPALGCEDWDLWLRVCRRHPVAVVPEELTRYRVHAANTPAPVVLASGMAVLAKLYQDHDAARAAGLSLAAAQARLQWYHASVARAQGRGAALSLAARAFVAAPASILTRPALGALARIALPRAPRGLLASQTCARSRAWR
jgi:glycosyltransferase involved in cell wall biosynthesis